MNAHQDQKGNLPQVYEKCSHGTNTGWKCSVYQVIQLTYTAFEETRDFSKKTQCPFLRKEPKKFTSFLYLFYARVHTTVPVGRETREYKQRRKAYLAGCKSIEMVQNAGFYNEPVSVSDVIF